MSVKSILIIVWIILIVISILLIPLLALMMCARCTSSGPNEVLTKLLIFYGIVYWPITILILLGAGLGTLVSFLGESRVRKVCKIVWILIGIICFSWFAVPLSLSVNLNIGNTTGLIVSTIWILLGIFLPFVQKLVHKWSKHPMKKWFYRVPIAIVCVIAVLVITESKLMIAAANKTPDENVTVVVLGCRVYGEAPSLSMVERLDAAYEFLVENEQTKCILSGGKGEGENISEAECMYRYLVDKGIDAKRLYREEQSTNTRENLLFAKEMIETEGLQETIAIATSEYHVYRAGLIAEVLDMEYSSIPGKTAIWLFPTYYVRELYGILYEWVF